MVTGRHNQEARQVNALFLIMLIAMGSGLILDQFGLLPKVHVNDFGTYNAAIMGSVEAKRE
jgi:hypothetical protein